VGTPPQKLDLIADTGNSFPVIVQSCACKKASSYFQSCEDTEECLEGSRSSTYEAPKPTAPLLGLSFGVGDIVVAAASDVVRVGQENAMMDKGLLLVEKRMFKTTYSFEGILGLGVPSWTQSKRSSNASSSPLDSKDLTPGERIRLPSFLEVAQVRAFSICFIPGQGGALNLDPVPMTKMLTQVGRNHWSLKLTGFTVGNSNVPIRACNAKLQKSGSMDSFCAAIPDSGTTHIMGPKKDVEDLLSEVCNQWPRCKTYKSQEHTTSIQAFRSVLWDCNGWMSKDVGISEVPSIFVNLEGRDGERDSLEITAMDYVYQTTSMVGNSVCVASFEEWNHTTKSHGSAWILGTPLFYGYQVEYSLDPPAIGFGKAPCDLCDEASALMLHDKSRASRTPRTMNGDARLPSFTLSDQL